MAKHLPDYHSPLVALGKKVLLWTMLPAALVLGLFYVLDTSRSPSERELVIQRMNEREDKMLEPLRREAEAQRLRLEADPRAIKATDAELAKATQTERGRDALALAQYNAAMARNASSVPVPAKTAANGDYKSITPDFADYVLQRKSSTELRIVFRAGAIPAGTTVAEGNTNVATCSSVDPCTELKLSTVPNTEGSLKIRDASGAILASLSINQTTLGMIRGTIPLP